MADRGKIESKGARRDKPPVASLPGGYDFAQRAWFDRIGAVGTALGEVTRAPDAGRTGQPLRARLSAHIHDRVAGSPGGIAAALVTGDRGAISDADAEAMRRSGLAHLLSISGLHVTAVVGFALRPGEDGATMVRTRRRAHVTDEDGRPPREDGPFAALASLRAKA